MDEFQCNTNGTRLRVDEVEAILSQLFAAPVVDASQVPLHHRERIDIPELELHRAILFDAITCAVRHHDSRLRSQRLEAQSALRWIGSKDETYFLSFIPICQRFGIDPDWIRRLLSTRVRRARSTAPERTPAGLAA